MRKKSREMTAQWAREVMDEAPYVTVAFNTPEGAYAVPLSLARVGDVYYFHCAPEGRKIDAIASDGRVSLSAVAECRPTMNPKTGGFTLEFRSAMGQGTASVVQSKTEKLSALRAICQRFLPAHMAHFDEAAERSLRSTCLVRIELTAPLTGKRKAFAPDGSEMRGNKHG